MMRKRHNSKCLSLVCLALITSLGMVGVGFAAWQEGLVVQGTVGTGNIDPVFTKCELAGESCTPTRVQGDVANAGKSLNITFAEAYPGYYAHLTYRVTNEGTVPVRCETWVSCPASGLRVEHSFPVAVLDGGSSQTGDLMVYVEAVEENKKYDFTAELIFKQWNVP
ncbi:MAG: hypothetical protein PHC60_08850 [Heliobacteriaceae bacterium]|nr:hypothetical protein [Heliobacteriaceae bacterium]